MHALRQALAALEGGKSSVVEARACLATLWDEVRLCPLCASIRVHVRNGSVMLAMRMSRAPVWPARRSKCWCRACSDFVLFFFLFAFSFGCLNHWCVEFEPVLAKMLLPAWEMLAPATHAPLFCDTLAETGCQYRLRERR